MGQSKGKVLSKMLRSKWMPRIFMLAFMGCCGAVLLIHPARKSEASLLLASWLISHFVFPARILQEPTWRECVIVAGGLFAFSFAGTIHSLDNLAELGIRLLFRTPIFATLFLRALGESEKRRRGKNPTILAMDWRTMLLAFATIVCGLTLSFI